MGGVLSREGAGPVFRFHCADGLGTEEYIGGEGAEFRLKQFPKTRNVGNSSGRCGKDESNGDGGFDGQGLAAEQGLRGQCLGFYSQHRIGYESI